MSTSTRWLFEAPLPHQPTQPTTSPAEWEDAATGLQEATRPSASVAAPVPRFSHSEASPLDQTLYASIPLGGESPAKPLTGIFIPAGYRVRGAVDLVLYLQGHRTHPDAEWFRALTIDKYWDSKKFPCWAFREATNASGKNVI